MDDAKTTLQAGLDLAAERRQQRQVNAELVSAETASAEDPECSDSLS